MLRTLLILSLSWLVAASSGATELPIALATPGGPIAGTLRLPERSGLMPVALLIAGSGPTDRDGNGPVTATRNDSLRLLSAALAEIGVASVRFDKRGIAGSAGAMVREADLRFDTYVQDARAWIELLANDARFRGVVVIGHSEGAAIGMLAAKGSAAQAYVSLAGLGRRASDVLRQQLQGKLPPELAASSEAILSSLERGHSVAEVPSALLALYRPSVQPYLISWFALSPAEAFQSLSLPSLIVQGDTDIQVPVSEAELLHQARPDARLVVIAGMNHVLKSVPAERAQQIASYGDPALPLAPTLVRELAAFLQERFGAEQVAVPNLK